MIKLLALKILGAVAGVAAAGTAVFVLAPPLVTPTSVWIDSPADGAIIEEGPVTITLHSDLPGLTGMQAVLVRDGEVVATLTDNDLEVTSRGANAVPLSWFAQDWNAEAGVYEVRVATCTLSGACWETQRTATLTVVEQDPVLVQTAEGTTAPALSATPTPTPTPTPTTTPDPVETVVPTPDPTVAPPVYEMPYGFIRQTVTDSTKLSSYFTIRAATPQQSVASVQVQVVPAGQGPVESAWTSIPCTTALTPDPDYTDGFTCSTATYTVPPSGGSPRTGYYRIVLVNGDKTYIGDYQYWSMTR